MKNPQQHLNLKQLVLSNTFIRNFTSTLTILYFSSVLIERFSSKLWVNVVLGSQLFSFLFILFASLSLGKVIQLIYAACLSVAILALTRMHALSATEAWVAAITIWMLFLDIAGDWVVSNTNQNLFSPMIYRQIIEKTSFLSLSGQAVASIALWGLSKSKFFSHIPPFLSLLWIIHLFLYLKTLSLSKKEIPRISETENPLQWEEQLSYLKKNPLIINITLLMIWGQMIKIIAENIYMTSINEITGQVHVSALLSKMSLGILLINLIFQSTVGNRFLRKFSPSFIFGIQPFWVLIVGLLSFLINSPYIRLGLCIGILIINRGVSNPIIRITLQSIQRRYREKSYFFINGVVTFALLLTAFFIKGILSRLNSDYLIFTLIGMSFLIFVFVFQFDSHYLRSLWKNFVNETSHGEEPSFAGLHPILKSYLNDQTEPQLEKSVDAHLNLLNSSDAACRELGITLVGLSGLKPMVGELSKRSEIEPHAQSTLHYLDLIQSIKHPAVDTQTKFKMSQLMHSDHTLLPEQEKIEMFKFEKLQSRELVASLLNLLLDPASGADLHFVITLINQESPKLDFRLIIQELMKRSYADSHFLRQMMISLSSFKETVFHHNFIVDLLHTSESLNQLHTIDHLKKCLFLAEWTTHPTPLLDSVLRSIDQYEELNEEDQGYWKNLHLEFVKKTGFPVLIDSIRELS